jgi:tetratricopeptide (TPR) repeat protein
MAVAYQLFLLPDDASHESAMQQILFAYEFTDHNEEIIRVLRILSQKQLDDQVSISVQQTARQLLWYIEADGKQETKKELLAAADALLKVIVNRSSFPVGLLAHIYRKRGFAFRSLNQFEQAIIDYTRAIELDPTYARAYASRGSAYRRLKEYERAMQDYNRALELEPNYAWAYCGRGETYRLLKEYALALADLNRALELEPNYARAYAQRALLHLWLGKMELARLDYIQAWESSATLVNAAWMAEWCTMCQGNIGAELIQRLEAITAAHPYHYVGYICRGVMLWQQQQYNAALLAFEQAIQLEPEAWDAYFWKGMVHATLSQDVDAAVAVENALASGIPPVLLSPLQWLALKRPDFYERYVIPLLTSSNS